MITKAAATIAVAKTFPVKKKMTYHSRMKIATLDIGDTFYNASYLYPVMHRATLLMIDNDCKLFFNFDGTAMTLSQQETVNHGWRKTKKEAIDFAIIHHLEEAGDLRDEAHELEKSVNKLIDMRKNLIRHRHNVYEA